MFERTQIQSELMYVRRLMWFKHEPSPTDLCVLTLGPQLMALFYKVVVPVGSGWSHTGGSRLLWAGLDVL